MRAGFLFSSVLTGIRRNLTMMVALILSTAIALAFIGAAILAHKEIGKLRSQYEGNLYVSVFLCTKLNGKEGGCVARPVLGANGKQEVVDGIPQTDSTTTAAQQAAIDTMLSDDPLVASHSYVSPEQQFQQAEKTLPPSYKDGLRVGDLAASFTVKLKNIQRDYQAFRARYQKVAGVSTTTNAVAAVNALLDIINGVLTISLALAVVVLIASILLIANTIQVAAAQRRNETSIMRLVGASRWMTELPFLFETAIASFIGGIIGAAMVWGGKAFVLNNVFQSQTDNGIIPDLNANDMLEATGIALGSGIIVAALTAFLTLRLYVKL